MDSHRVKVVLLGQQGVGKTSIERRYVTGRFEPKSKATFNISPDFTTKGISVKDQTVMLEIWDTVGQERFNSLTSNYCRGAQAAIVVYDVTDRDTYNKALEWIHELRQKFNTDTDIAENPNKDEMVIALVGNKIDTPETSRNVFAEEAASYASENGLLYAETSATTGLGVDDLFLQLAKAIAERFDLEVMSKEKDGVSLYSLEGSKTKKGICCQTTG